MNDVGRVLGADALKHERARAKARGEVFVFTNGCFDLLHRGHIELLKAAKALGDLLAVGLNSDKSVRRIKGRYRPLVSQDHRAVTLAAVRYVDFVVIFEEDTPERIISLLKPDVLVKGSDYQPEEIVGRREVEAAGGRVVRVPIYGGLSTRRLMAEIGRRCKDMAGEASDTE